MLTLRRPSAAGLLSNSAKYADSVGEIIAESRPWIGKQVRGLDYWCPACQSQVDRPT
jgi:hypothetical protein